MIFSELNALSKIEHPFVVKLHYAFHDKYSCYFVFDLKTGHDLRYYLKRNVVFEEKHVALYIACISSALNHIHKRGVIHRDVKPENIILDVHGFPHLIDFGVAHVQDEQNEGPLVSKLASGTKQYLAPGMLSYLII
jgi:serine/threonine protein kinase